MRLAAWVRVLWMWVVAGVAACSSDSDSIELKPGTAVVYQRTLNSNLSQIESMGALDLVRDGNDVVVLIAYGYTIFTTHPGLPGNPSTGGSTASGGYILAISRDGGATFSSSPMYATSEVSGEPVGVYLNAGRAWVLMLSDGPVDSNPLKVHPLDLATATLSAASPGQQFTAISGGVSSVAFSGDRLTASVSEHRNSGVQGGAFGFQELVLSTGAFTDRTVGLTAADSCTTKLYSNDQGQTWEGYRECGGLGMCRFTTVLASGIPTKVCVPPADWPGPITEAAMAITDAGMVQVYARDGQSFAALMRGAQGVEIPLGAGEIAVGFFRPGPHLRLPYGPLIPIEYPVNRLVALSSTGAAFNVAIPTPCVDDAGCPSEVSRVLPLGGDEYLSLHTATLEGDRQKLTLLLRRDTVVKVPVTGSGPVPVPGCPSAIPASPVVNACAIAAVCFPGLDVRNCIREWTPGSIGPTAAAFDAFVATTTCAGMQTSYPRAALAHAATCTPGCAGTTAVQSCSTNSLPHLVSDCAAVGMTCSNTGPNGIGCYDGQSAPCGACDALGRAVSCPDGKPEVIACGSLGLVCSTATGAAQCVGPACTINAQSCNGDQLCGPGNGVVDCGALGLPCTQMGSSARCEDTNVGTPCPTQACSGQYMLVDLGYERAYVDCVALGYSTCVEAIVGYPRCSL